MSKETNFVLLAKICKNSSIDHKLSKEACQVIKKPQSAAVRFYQWRQCLPNALGER
jgi:hypothetical protein